MNTTSRRLVLGASILLATACGDSAEDEACDVGTHEGCEDDQVCEEVADGEPACFAPIVLTGQVFDLQSDADIEDATVVARDANGAARSDVVRTGPAGGYSLQVPTVRTEDGEPVETVAVTLRVDAAGYQPYPQAPRTALPIDVEVTVDENGGGSIENPATRVGLIALPTADGVSVSGSLGVAGAGALVVAERGGQAVSTAVADSMGDFILFNVPEGDIELGAWGAGVYAAPESVKVGSDGAQDVSLTADTDVGVGVSGSVTFANAPGDATTSVILVLDSTFDEDLVRGETPPGLRAAGVKGAFSLEDVPPGRYAVLAAFENDDLVRDPDEGIGGTDIVFVDVTAKGDVTLDESFKVTEALATVSPGAEMLETVGDSPSLVWADDSSEDGYELRVYDTFGQLIFEDTEVPRVTGSETVTYELDAVTLDAGMIYQFRVFSWRDNKGERRYISATEDLRGTFQIEE